MSSGVRSARQEGGTPLRPRFGRFRGLEVGVRGITGLGKRSFGEEVVHPAEGGRTPEVMDPVIHPDDRRRGELEVLVGP